MRTEYHLFHVLGVTSESRVKFVGSIGISIKAYIPVFSISLE